MVVICFAHFCFFSAVFANPASGRVSKMYFMWTLLSCEDGCDLLCSFLFFFSGIREPCQWQGFENVSLTY
jgi:hypothetical protein